MAAPPLPRAVFDSNVLISAFRFPGSVSEKAFNLCLAGAARLIASPTIVDEVAGVLRRKFGVDAKDAAAIGAFIQEASECVQPQVSIQAVKADPDDNAILECAVWAEAHYVVTGDKAHLWPLDPLRGIRILGPQAFIATLAESEENT